MPSSALTDDLPVRAVLPALDAALASGGNAVLVAPPGAGKTTLVAPSLLAAPWLSNRKILLMLPRRLAARAAAERIAAILGEEPGRQVGYRTRLESRPGSRIECVTEGLFVNRLLADPGLEDVGLLLFDEVHERNLEGDLGLALALDTQQLRDDLRIVAMSATLDGARFSRLMADAPVLESAGRQFPVTIQYAGRSDQRIEDRMSSAIHAALRHEGSLLAFLPGVAEIVRTAERLHLPPEVELHCLYGTADPAAQRAVLAPSAARRVVLATAIAETSLTVPGVRIVLDSGLARRPRHDRATGLTRLVTERVSQAAASQRAGRAGREGPGLVIRLWEEGETRGFIPFDPPEILEADLAPTLLRLAAWGVTKPDALHWLDPPPTPAVAVARARLLDLGAIDDAGRATAHGRRLVRLPLAPHIAHMLLLAAAHGQALEAALLAVASEESGAGGSSVDIDDRVRRLRAGRSRHVALAERWAAMARKVQPRTEHVPLSPGRLLAEAFPDRVARRRRAPGASDQMVDYQMANGRAVRLAAHEPLARSDWLVVIDASGGGPSATVRLATALAEAEVADWVAHHGEAIEALQPDPASGRLAMVRTTRLGAIEFNRQRVAASPEQVTEALLAEVRSAGLTALAWPDAERTMLARLRFAAANGLAGLPDVSDAGLLALADMWLAPRLAGVLRLADVDLAGALKGLLDWPTAQALDRFAPPRLETAAATSAAIDYAAEGGPAAAIRVQALFGRRDHPMVADGRVPLTVVLLSPAGRDVARTRDLPAFWANGWRDVQRDMKGRYPKHPWPDDPASATPTTRTKARDAVGSAGNRS